MPEPDVYLSPGERLRELLRDRSMSQAELARRTGYTAKHVNQLCQDNASITPSAAIKLERALGVSATAFNTWSTEHTDRTLREAEKKRKGRRA